jgi:hypothetical protein
MTSRSSCGCDGHHKTDDFATSTALANGPHGMRGWFATRDFFSCTTGMISALAGMGTTEARFKSQLKAQPGNSGVQA